MESNQERMYKVLLEKMTPVYTLVPVIAAGDEDVAAKAIDRATQEGREWSHDRLPGHEVWSLIPPVQIFMATEDGEVKVLGVAEGNVDTAGLTCRGSAIVTGDGFIVAPQFMDLGEEKEIPPEEDAV